MLKRWAGAAGAATIICVLLLCARGNAFGYVLYLWLPHTPMSSSSAAGTFLCAGLAAPNDTAALLALKAAWSFEVRMLGFSLLNLQARRVQTCF